jgi:hypothetical protein
VRKRLVPVAVLVAASLVACGAVLGTTDDVEPPIRNGDDASSDVDSSRVDASDDVGEATDGAAVDAPANTDSGVDSGRPKYVFVTSQRYSGGFGTRGDADAACTFLAKQANMPLFGASTFKAYLAAGNNVPASARITDRVYVRMDNKAVFAPGPQTNPTPSDLVVLDETGANLSLDTNKFVWTGHAKNVAASDRTCADWASGAGTAFGGFGDMHTLANWGESNGATAGCDSSFRLYCFED